MKLCIKNMVSLRCKMTVRVELEKANLHPLAVELGVVEIEEQISGKAYSDLKIALLVSGLEVVEDRKIILVERIKNVVIELVHYTDEQPRTKFSYHLSQRLGYSYAHLARLFSRTQGTTIEHFLIAHRIERVKELLAYGELNLSEIAWKLHYSSVAHLSSQFKKTTGTTPTFFRNSEHKRLSVLDGL